MNLNQLGTLIVSSIVFSVVGIVVFCAGFVILDKLTPYNLWRELIEKQNNALAIVVGFACLGIAIIIASCLHG
jgi:putative membrane protein